MLSIVRRRRAQRVRRHLRAALLVVAALGCASGTTSGPGDGGGEDAVPEGADDGVPLPEADADAPAMEADGGPAECTAAVEICNGHDDDCDGSTDEDDVCICWHDDECDDGDPCNGVETCNPGVTCVLGTPVDCDDGVPCTIDQCSPMSGSCIHTAQDDLCSDGDPCNGAETCDGARGCLGGTPPDCADDLPCTMDSCGLDGSCVHAPVDSLCDDPVFCDGRATCDPDLGCREGAPPDCDDGVACTDDRCSPDTDSCVGTPVDARCDDGQLCNGTERCSATGCLPGTAPGCDDGLACTADSCDSGAAGGHGACVHRPPDVDGDTYPPTTCLGTDCNDRGVDIHPGATERCNAVDDDCNGATDEAFECIRDAPGPCTVGSCSGVRVCSATCRWGACEVLAGELCNGVDDDCNGATDEAFACRMGATQPCTVSVPTRDCPGTRTCVGPGCTWGSCVVDPGGGNVETCNAVDDDCDGTIDDAPSPPDVLCAPRDHAGVACSSGTCVLTCDPGWADTDGGPDNGCECRLEAVDPADSCSGATSLGTLVDPAGNVAATGKITSAVDVDCFTFAAADSADEVCDDFHVDVRFESNPGGQFQFTLWQGDCGAPECADSLEPYDWYADFTEGSRETKKGECPCRSLVADDFNLCRDDGATFMFCVSRRPGFAPSCDSYAVRVTNGLY
jgi:hypothetical protein